MAIGERLDQAMKLRRITSQGELARRSGVPQPTINRTLQNQTRPELETLKKLAAALEVDVLWLAEEEGTEPKPSDEREDIAETYARRLAVLFAGRPEAEIRRIVRAVELLVGPTPTASDTRSEVAKSFEGDVPLDGVQIRRRSTRAANKK